MQPRYSSWPLPAHERDSQRERERHERDSETERDSMSLSCAGSTTEPRTVEISSWNPSILTVASEIFELFNTDQRGAGAEPLAGDAFVDTLWRPNPFDRCQHESQVSVTVTVTVIILLCREYWFMRC